MDGIIRESYDIGGISFSSVVRRTGETALAISPVTLRAGVAGKRSASGIDTLPTGHGFLAQDVCDVHWSVDGARKCRRAVTIDGATANAVTFDDNPAASGDTLPANGTDLVLSHQEHIGLDVDGDTLEMFAFRTDGDAVMALWAGVSEVQFAKLTAKEAYSWVKEHIGLSDGTFAGLSFTEIVASSATTQATQFVGGAILDTFTEA